MMRKKGTKYSQGEKEAIVKAVQDEVAAQDCTVKQACDKLGVSMDSYYKMWRDMKKTTKRGPYKRKTILRKKKPATPDVEFSAEVTTNPGLIPVALISQAQLRALLLGSATWA
jgi:transposase-like protein